jgi:predicted ribosome quality control (RQC) complex YloA/Tae2 family protein
MKEIIIENTTYRIGQNAADNTQLIKDSEPEMTWFHLEKFPSAHVIICKTDPTSDEIQEAARLVWENSKYKFKNIGMIYCKVKNIIHGEEPGSVSFVSKRQVTQMKYI